MKRVMKQNRRKFFGLVGAGALGVTVSQLLPFKLFAGNNLGSTDGRKPKVAIHPLAVPRKKGGNS